MAGDEAMVSVWPLPVTDDPIDAGFWAAAADARLVVQSCGNCGRRTMPPRPMCPSCQSVDRVWEPVSGYGTIWSWTVGHPPLLPAFTELAPYAVIVVALEEDPSLRLVGNVVTDVDAPINSVDPSTIQFGERVQAVFPKIDDVALVRWIRVPPS